MVEREKIRVLEDMRTDGTCPTQSVWCVVVFSDSDQLRDLLKATSWACSGLKRRTGWDLEEHPLGVELGDLFGCEGSQSVSQAAGTDTDV